MLSEPKVTSALLLHDDELSPMAPPDADEDAAGVSRFEAGVAQPPSGIIPSGSGGGGSRRGLFEDDTAVTGYAKEQAGQGRPHPRLPRPDATRVILTSSPTHLSILIPAASCCYYSCDGGLLTRCVVSILLLLWGGATAVAIYFEFWLAILFMTIGWLAVLLFLASAYELAVREHLEVAGGQYTLTRERRGLQCLGFGRPRVRHGALRALWGIQVVSREHEVFHRDNGKLERRTKSLSSVEWVDGGHTFWFGNFLESDEERLWVVGEVLAWMEQDAAADHV